MKSIIKLILLAFISSCATAPLGDPREFTTTNKEFYEFVDMYVSIKGSDSAKKIPINFKKVSRPQIAFCRFYRQKVQHGFAIHYKEIFIDPEFWRYASYFDKISVIFHELGHCDLNRDHNNSLDEFGYPISIMNATLVQLNPLNITDYINELFGFKPLNLKSINSNCVELIDN
jgi:hypothetical protein